MKGAKTKTGQKPYWRVIGMNSDDDFNSLEVAGKAGSFSCHSDKTACAAALSN
jgi:hypothetical protein